MIRKEKKKKVPKPTVTSQLTVEENNAAEAIVKATGRTMSYVVRVAIIRMLADNANGLVDWGKNLTEDASVNTEAADDVRALP